MVHLRDTHITPPTHHCISVSAAVPMALFVALFFFVLLSGSFGMNLTCSLEDCPPPTTEPLFITDAAHLCTMSDLYGQELTEEFVGRVAEVGDTQGGPKLWQLRTVTVQDNENRNHHILLPWVINSGGLTPMVGRAAKVLRKYGARELDTDPVWCRLRMHLPLKSFKCARQWSAGSRFDSGDDIRNNMIGDKHAQAILIADGIVDSVLHGVINEETYVKLLRLHFPDAPEENLRHELELLKKAPCSTVFPPPRRDIPVLSEDREL